MKSILADLPKWNQSFQEHFSIVAVDAGIIVGFGDVDKTGYLDRLFVHSDYQEKGIATAICNQLESAVQRNLVTHASITARPFFEKRGYQVVKEQQVERQGILFANLDSISGNFSTAAKSVGDALVALGVDVLTGTTLNEMATIIRASLAKKASHLSGSYYLSLMGGSTDTRTINFSAHFKKRRPYI